MAVKFETTEYEGTHGRLPKGTGGWIFSFKRTTGERVELTFNPLRDGKHGGAFDQAKVLDTGKVWATDLREAEKPGLK